jgi:hypothetical protein
MTKTKRIVSQEKCGNQETALVHLIVAATAGVVASTATNLVWPAKTRPQLDKSFAEKAGQYGWPDA